MINYLHVTNKRQKIKTGGFQQRKLKQLIWPNLNAYQLHGGWKHKQKNQSKLMLGHIEQI